MNKFRVYHSIKEGYIYIDLWNLKVITYEKNKFGFEDDIQKHCFLTGDLKGKDIEFSFGRTDIENVDIYSGDWIDHKGYQYLVEKILEKEGFLSDKFDNCKIIDHKNKRPYKSQSELNF